MANLVQVVMGICLLTVAFALLIWYGMYDNPIDSVKMAQVSIFLSNFITSIFFPISACASDFLAYHMLRVACGIPMLQWRYLVCVMEDCYAPPCMHRLVLFLIISHMHDLEKKSVTCAVGLVCNQVLKISVILTLKWIHQAELCHSVSLVVCTRTKSVTLFDTICFVDTANFWCTANIQ